MADEQTTATAAEDVSTPSNGDPVVVAENPVIETPGTDDKASTPPDSGDVWENLGKDLADKDEKEADKPAEKPAEPVKTEEKDEKADAPDKSDDETAVLDDLFGEKDEDDADMAEPEAKETEKKDEDAPEKMIAALRPAARKWAERNAKNAELIKEFQHGTDSITTIAERLHELSPERFNELSRAAAEKLVDENPDAAFIRAYAVKMLAKDPKWDYRNAEMPTLDDLLSANGKITAPQITREPSEVTKTLDGLFNWDWRDASLDEENFVDDTERALASAVRDLEAKLQEVSAEAERLKTLETTVKTNDATAQEAELSKRLNESIATFRESVESRITPYLLKNAGLEVADNDTEEVKAFKRQTALMYTGTMYEKANHQDSAFERFVYQESSVKSQYETVTQRIVNLQAKAAQAAIAGKNDEAQKFTDAAEDEKLALYPLFHTAQKEFKAKVIAPALQILGNVSATRSNSNKQAATRKEVVSSNGTPVSKPTSKATTFEGVFDEAVERAREMDRAATA